MSKCHIVGNHMSSEICDQVTLHSACSATETSKNVEIVHGTKSKDAHDASGLCPSA